VYASQPGSPQGHATLGSGGWLILAGSGLSPAGFLQEVSILSFILPSDFPLLQALPGALSAETPSGFKAESSVEPQADEPYAAERADALCLMAETFQAGEITTRNGADRCQVVIHVDEQVLKSPQSPGRCECEAGPALAAQTARRLACDASLVRVVEDEYGEPLSVGRKTRSIPPALRRALQLRDKHCRFPGCSSRHSLDCHHLEHWADGGETKVENLALICGLCRARHKPHYADSRIMPRALLIRLSARVELWRDAA